MSVAGPGRDLLVGPLLRYAGTTTATVWVETARPAEVTVLEHRARTFNIEGHHYALVLIEDLEPGTVTPYDVRLEGRLVWPPDDGRQRPAIRTREGEREARLVFGSCRVGAPERPPYSLSQAEHEEGLEVDALWAYSRRLQQGEVPWPDALLLLGDQVYADLVPPETAAFIRSRRDVREPPGEEVADFEEYTRLYRESWSDPDIRWLLSTVPCTMIFDDHDVNDDWNISDSWVEEMRRLPWWEDRVTGAFMSYWLYQHIGNLSPPELAEETLLHDLRDDEDGGPRLRALARQWDRESAATRWAYYRDFGRSRLLVIDSRAARVTVEGRRDMIDEEEWHWIADHAHGRFDHLILATSLPVFLPPGVHHLEAWNEAVCDGAWGAFAQRLGERLRRAVDLEHWAAYPAVFPPSHGAPAIDWLRRRAAGHHHHPQRRHPHELCRLSRSRRGVGSEPCPSGRLLTLPQSAQPVRAPSREDDRISSSGSCLLHACSRLRCAAAGREMDDLQPTDVPQLDRRARPRSAPCTRHPVPQHARTGAGTPSGPRPRLRSRLGWTGAGRWPNVTPQARRAPRMPDRQRRVASSDS